MRKYWRAKYAHGSFGVAGPLLPDANSTPTILAKPNTGCGPSWRGSPALEQVMLDAKLITDAADDEIERVLEGPRTRVEGGHRREDHGPCLGTECQIAELDGAQRRFPRHQD